ncbi:hypothetical protein GCM10011383_24550 [Hymenobacter cavernae]|uniref:Uncharacterized protein n=1 Tax=Hymenobacter cavernae TaxID=2044852 RepID=A0ABQ1U9I9_9BACT|nr:hypothetical protein GCM10011383_24550 [Hymenobacter cavernae]
MALATPAELGLVDCPVLVPVTASSTSALKVKRGFVMRDLLKSKLGSEATALELSSVLITKLL